MGFTYSEFANTGYNYQIFNSLRIRQSASSYISRTPISNGDSQKWTWSGWVKFGAFSAFNLSYMAQNTSTTATYFGRSANSWPSKFFVLHTDGTERMLGVTEASLNDPSAWYHIVVAIDTTQATAATGLKIYINGVLQALTSSETVWTQNTSTYMNQTSALHLMGGWVSQSFYADQLYSEVNFIDGQQLDVSNFGVIDQTSGQWVAKKYSGTYGINGFYLPFNDVNNTSANILTYSEDFTNAAWGKEQVAVTANASSAPDGSTTADKIIASTVNTPHYFYQTQTASNVTQVFSVYAKAAEYSILGVGYSNFVNDGRIVIFNIATGTVVAIPADGPDFTNISAGAYDVGNGWYRLWVKFTKGTFNTQANAQIQLYDNSFNGTFAGNGTDGVFLWGAQVQTNTLPGYYRATGATALTTAVNNIGADQSNGASSWNFFTPTNISLTAGSTYDAFRDVPSGSGQLAGTQPNSNYPTFNPLDGLNLGLSQTNLLSAPAQSYYATSTMAFPSSGKWYVEYNIVASTNSIVGVSTKQKANNLSNLGASTGEIGYYWNGQAIKENVSQAGTWSSFNSFHVVGMAVDADAKTVSFYNNNVLTGSAISYSSFTSEIFASFGTYFVGGQAAINFGQRPFTYTPPSGFKALCTANLPSSAVVKGNTQMDATLFTGTGATQTITNAGSFRSDIVWIKSYSNVTSHYTFDAIAGPGVYTSSNISPLPSATDVNTLTSFNSNGFTLGSGATGCNSVSDLEVAWQWQAGASAVTDTTGSITTTVRANPTAGISIIGYTGTGTVGTLGHGLGTAPSLIMSKTLSSGTGNWLWYHQSLGPTQAAFANSTAVPGTNIGYWNNTAPASSVYTVLSSGGTNVATRPYFAYVFAQVLGFSKFDRYTGNGAADGPFVYLGFRPKLVLIKRTDTTSNWIIWDSVRNPYNIVNYSLNNNTSSANITSADVDFLANGFKLRNTGADYNASGGTYIYCAWAENPFQNANAR